MPALQNEHHVEGTCMNTKLHSIQDWQELSRQANWSVTKLAELCNVSARGLELHFRKNFGQTPKNWLAEQRQRRAIKLLRGGSSVKETAGQLGYKHANHLSREFKKYWGHRPTQTNLISSEAAQFRVLV